MKVGFIQFQPALGDPDRTIEVLGPLVEEGAGADLLVLPELCNCGYNFNSREHARDLSEEADASRFLKYLQDECRRHELRIAAGFNERDGKDLYNSSVLVGPGGVIGMYRKLHLFMDEKDIFTPGNLGLPVFDLGDCRVGMLVCFDWMFPEAWRSLALDGADLICHPSNLVLPGFAQSAVPVHALLNRVFTITANRVGTEGKLTFTGQSVIAGPKGEILAEGPLEGSAVRVIEVDVNAARDKAVTPRNHALDDRRPELYDRLNRK